MQSFLSFINNDRCKRQLNIHIAYCILAAGKHFVLRKSVLEEMSSENSENCPPTKPNYPRGVKFEVEMNSGWKKTTPVPKRFSEQSIKTSLSLEDLYRKQKEAEFRRKVTICMPKAFIFDHVFSIYISSNLNQYTVVFGLSLITYMLCL